MPLGLNGIVTEDRGNEPALWHHSVMTPSITFTWHHTIPWNCLRAVWNGVVHGRHWDAIEAYLDLISASNVSTIVRDLKNGNLTIDRDLLHTQLTWQGWNIVEGPGNEYRNDDPGEQFDGWSGAGMSGNQTATLLAVKGLYDNCMRRIQQLPAAAGTNNIPNISAQDAKTVATAMRGARHALRGKQPVKWEEKMWFPVTEGRVDKSRPGIWYTKPVWRRRTAAEAIR